MKQSPLVQAKNLHLTFNFFAPEAPLARAAQIAAGFTELMPVAKLTPPAIGEYWPGQGGIYLGVSQYPEGLCHLIAAASDVGKHAYGEYGSEVDAVDRNDGSANTASLVSRGGSHPAADAAYAYTCDGHSDFYLPAIGELSHAWRFAPDSFEKAWYVSSSQFSAHDAYFMDFEDGWLGSYDKNYERLVRPVRRILQ